MHIARIDVRSLDEAAQPVDLGQSPADAVFLSFSDSDLGALAAAWRRMGAEGPDLRLASLSALRNPWSVDVYVEKICSRARFVLVRLLGGADYWRYGVDELAACARRNGVKLAFIPGDYREDPRLDEASTIAIPELRQLWRYFEEGGPDNLAACLSFIAHALGGAPPAPAPVAVEAFGRYGDRPLADAKASALIVFYRSILMAGDVAPIDALADALAARGISVAGAYVSSLKDPRVEAPLAGLITREGFDVIVNATAFSARVEGGSPLDRADAPVLQVALAGVARDQWAASTRGLGAADLAMHVVLPEIDGRIQTRAISFKEALAPSPSLEFAPVAHVPAQDRVEFVADLAVAWARLRRKPVAERIIACVLSDYPARAGRVGYAVGLDTPRSVAAIAQAMRDSGYALPEPPDPDELAARLSSGEAQAVLSLEECERALARLPESFARSIVAKWGGPADDPSLRDGFFRFRIVRLGKLIVAVQPDRGSRGARKSEYHDSASPPRHAYVAFYHWLRAVERIDAMIHCGTHGTLEWLPGKSVALSASCAPEATLGPVPLVYPFIVNNPGEAAQAKRRISAVTIGHMTPPLVAAGSHGAAAELEALFDEYAQAQTLDARRARAIAAAILDRAGETGLLEECAAGDLDPEPALLRLDAWLCDLKDMRVGDGLHVFGVAPEPSSRAEHLQALCAAGGADVADVAASLDACAEAEMSGLLTALDGRFVEPGPAGAPARGRLDVLPTGRNLFTVDPRAVPTRAAWEIGRRVAQEVVARYAADHGDWPKRIVLDLWGSASMRTGGDDIAQAFALLGARPRWDEAASRVTGYEILPLALVGRPRVDVTLRISGLFRDVFPTQIALLHRAIQDIAALDEPVEENPLVAQAGGPVHRIFGAAPGTYGVGIADAVARGEWTRREELGEIYLDATSHAYGERDEGEAAAEAFRAQVASADAFVHVQDMPGQDALDSDAFAEHEGGFAAAAEALGSKPDLYHADTTQPRGPAVRPLAQELARVMRGRALNPRWIAGQMRHGSRGAQEIAETLDNLFAYAALSDVAPSRFFDLYFDATFGDERVRRFLLEANPSAARGMARRFEEAGRRGMWTTRRNSSAEILARLTEAAA